MINIKYKSDLVARSFKFGIEIIKICETLPTAKSANIIANQLIRSSTSIGANLVESKASSTRLEFKKFNEISLKSANESKYWIEMLRELGLINNKTAVKVISELDEISCMLASGIKKLKVKT
ncbi:MAG: four helix bundle protein [Dehalococcoidales bacterium]|nr:four helix bundle protein [Dehalococcoidales bacterium]